jgi:hypothetical protein
MTHRLKHIIAESAWKSYKKIIIICKSFVRAKPFAKPFAKLKPTTS